MNNNKNLNTEIDFMNVTSDPETTAMLKKVATLQKDLQNYGKLHGTQKPLAAAGILLALHGNFNADSLTGDPENTSLPHNTTGISTILPARADKAAP